MPQLIAEHKHDEPVRNLVRDDFSEIEDNQLHQKVQEKEVVLQVLLQDPLHEVSREGVLKHRQQERLQILKERLKFFRRHFCQRVLDLQGASGVAQPFQQRVRFIALLALPCCKSKVSTKSLLFLLEVSEEVLVFFDGGPSRTSLSRNCPILARAVAGVVGSVSSFKFLALLLSSKGLILLTLELLSLNVRRTRTDDAYASSLDPSSSLIVKSEI